MIEHMVWIKFNEGVSADQKQQIIGALAALQETVPAIHELKIGENFTDRAAGYTHGLIVTVKDRASLPAYLEHPDHVKAAGPLKANASIMAMDIEV